MDAPPLWIADLLGVLAGLALVYPTFRKRETKLRLDRLEQGESRNPEFDRLLREVAGQVRQAALWLDRTDLLWLRSGCVLLLASFALKLAA